jgi:hypothetical protein
MLVAERVLGNEALAQELVEFYRPGRNYYDSPPEGWERIGSGCNRNVYKHASEPGVVYKLDNGLVNGGDSEKVYTLENSVNYGNAGEWATYIEWVERGNKSLPARLAATTRYMVGDYTVLACEYVASVGGPFNGRVPDIAREMVQEAYLWPSDFHDGNWAVDDKGHLVIIDFGHWSKGPQINWYLIERREEHQRRAADGRLLAMQIYCPCGCDQQFTMEQLIDMVKAKG